MTIIPATSYLSHAVYTDMHYRRGKTTIQEQYTEIHEHDDAFTPLVPCLLSGCFFSPLVTLEFLSTP
jgi:hypothetical protein